MQELSQFLAGFDRNTILVAGFALLGVIISTSGIITVGVLNLNAAKAEANALLAATTAKRSEKKLDTIHVLVNSRLQVALASLATLKRKLGLELLPEEIEAEKQVSKAHLALKMRISEEDL